MLNLAEYDPGAHPKDLPCWERSPTQKRGESTPDGRVDLFTWQSRRARLFDSQASDGSTQVDQVVLVPGLRVPPTWEPFRDESLLNFYYHRQARAGTPGWSQFRITTDRAVWRNSGAILHGLEEKTKNWQPTIVSEWIARLVEDEKLAENFTFSLEVLGFATQGDQKVLMWRREQLPISAGLLRDQWSRELLRSALRQAEDSAIALSNATERLAAEILSPPPSNFKKADRKRVEQLASSLGAELQYWSSLSTPFHEFLEALGRAQGITDEDARDSAYDAGFEAWKRSAGLFALYPCASSQETYGPSLGKALHQAKKGDEGLGPYLRARDVSIDYRQLMRDLSWWDAEDGNVQRRWGRDFWSGTLPENQQESAESVEEENSHVH